MPRGSQKQRFAIFQLLHEQALLGIDVKPTMEHTTQKTGYVIAEKELEKFAELYPHVNMDSFKEFLTKYDALKVSKRKVSTNTTRKGVGSAERAVELGLAGGEVEQFVSLLSQIKELGTQVNTLLGKRGLWQQAVKNPSVVKETESVPQ